MLRASHVLEYAAPATLMVVFPTSTFLSWFLLFTTVVASALAVRFWRQSQTQSEDGVASPSGSDVSQGEGGATGGADRLALAMRGTSDGLWDWQVTTNDMFLSLRFKQLLGFEEHEMEDTFEAWESRLYEEDREPTIHALKQHLENRVPYDVECRLYVKSGELRWFRARGQAIWADDGTPLRMAGSITNITRRKEAEAELLSSRQLYLSLVENLPVHLIRKDADGQFTFANQAFCKLLGKSRDEILHTTDFDHFPQELATKYRNDDQRVMDSGERFEDVEETSDGKHRGYFQVIKTPLFDADGNVAGTQAIFWDVTDRKHAEEQLVEAKEAAEVANKAKSEFLANMSHEIRTPLNAVIGMTELALETNLTATQKDYLLTVMDSGESLLAIINQILDFSKIEAGQLQLDRVVFELRELLGNTMRSLAVRGHRKGLELICNVDQGVPDRFHGDVTRLRQVVVNLVGNAIKFTAKGEIVLSVRVESSQDGTVRLLFSVADTGIGISADQQRKIFDAFQQADTSTTRRYGGTGLGLTISSQLVKLMGGEIWVESNVGHGSTFFFSLNLAEAPSRDEVDVDPDSVLGARVLVVDDNATNRRLLEQMLRGWGMIPLTVASAEEALAYLHDVANSPDVRPLVITDLNMPDKDGYMLTEDIRGNPMWTDLPVIVLSSSGSTDVATCERLRIAAQLLKPVKQSELFDAVAGAVGAPLRVRNQVAAPPESSMDPMSILLAEDGLANQKLACGMLEKWGHQVTLAKDGTEAVECWEQGDYDLILMDVQMPVMDGLEATRVIRQREKEASASRIPILAVTAHSMAGDEEKCLAAGMDDYISKPIRRKSLAEALRRAIRPDNPTQKESG